MSIKKFSQGFIYDCTNFANWLNENKAGTFLEDFSITNPSSNIMLFSKGSSSIELQFNDRSTDRIKFTGEYVSITLTSGLSQATTIDGGILCDNGLILRQAYNNIEHNICLITVDSNGNLAVLLNNSLSSEISTWYTISGKSTTTMSRNIRPYYSANLTSLAPLSVVAGDSGLYLPNVYVAVSTELAGESIQSVKIGTDEYITNGIWYVKDGA